MPTQTVYAAAAAVKSAYLPVLAWGYPSNAANATGAPDTAVATIPNATPSGQHYIEATLPSFTIPVGSTINSIALRVRASFVSGSPYWNGNASAMFVINGVLPTQTWSLAATGTISSGTLADYDAVFVPAAYPTIEQMNAGQVKLAVGGSAVNIDSIALYIDYTLPAAPTISAITPDKGPLASGANITINGSNFYSGATVTFDGTPATGVNVVSQSQLTCVVPAHAAGAVDVAVTSSGGTATLTDGYTYVQVRDAVVKLVVNGSVGSTNKGATSTDWPGTPAYAAYGGGNDLWGESLTPAIVNASNFGVVLSATVGADATAKVDHVRMQIYYTVPGSNDPSTLLAVMRVASDRQTVKPVIYKLPRNGFSVANDGNMATARRTHNASFFTPRYFAPHRAMEKIYRVHTFWTDFDAENANHPGLQVWARVDDGTAFQLTDTNGSGTLRTSGPQEVWFPPDDRSRGHYVQFEYRIPEIVGDQVPVAVSIRDALHRMVPRPRKTIPVNFTLVLTKGEFEDGGSNLRSPAAQLNELEALSRPGVGPVVIRDPQGEEFYAVVKRVTSKEVIFKGQQESTLVAYVLAWRLEYGD